MKKTIKLKESDLHRIIEQTINEMPSLDTLHAAKNASWDKVKRMQGKYGANDPGARRAYDQYKNIARGYDRQRSTEVGDDERRQMNRDNRNNMIDRGELGYVKGKGWRRANNESINHIVSESIRKALNEAEDGGWVVDSNEAREAYEFALENGFSKEELDSAIIEALSTDELAACLAYIFRMYDFRPWGDRQDAMESEDDEDYED